MRKHSENNPYKFMSSSHDSLSKRHTIFSSFEEISFKEGIDTDNINCHEVNKSFKVSITSFRDSTCAFKLIRLIDSRVNTREGDKIFMGIEVTDITDLCEEGCTGSRVNTINRSYNLEVLDHHRFTEREKHLCNLIQPFHKVKEGRDFTLEDVFLSKAYRAYRGISSFDYIILRDRDFSTSGGDFDSLSDSLRSLSFNNPCRGEFFKEVEHSADEDITMLQMDLSSGNVVLRILLISFLVEAIRLQRDSLSLAISLRSLRFWEEDSLEMESLWMRRNLAIVRESFLSVLVFLKESLAKLEISKGDFNAFRGEEGEEIGEFFIVRRNIVDNSREKPEISILAGREKLTLPSGSIPVAEKESLETSIPKRSLDIVSTSLKSYLDESGEASQPILHSDDGSETQSTYYGFGKQGTGYFMGATRQVKWSSLAFSSFTCKTRLCKFYNTNS